MEHGPKIIYLKNPDGTLKRNEDGEPLVIIKPGTKCIWPSRRKGTYRHGKH